MPNQIINKGNYERVIWFFISGYKIDDKKFECDNIKKFIIENEEALLDHWYEEIDTFELTNRLVCLNDELKKSINKCSHIKMLY
jgi:hypothetical protein